jgi:hypothetical protein
MELVVGLIALVAFATGARMLGSAYGRGGPSGMFRGLFGATGLDWPAGVQEEDRDRVWSWSEPAEPAEPVDPDGELVEVSNGAVPVGRVR